MIRRLLERFMRLGPKNADAIVLTAVVGRVQQSMGEAVHFDLIVALTDWPHDDVAAAITRATDWGILIRHDELPLYVVHWARFERLCPITAARVRGWDA